MEEERHKITYEMFSKIDFYPKRYQVDMFLGEEKNKINLNISFSAIQNYIDGYTYDEVINLMKNDESNYSANDGGWQFVVFFKQFIKVEKPNQDEIDFSFYDRFTDEIILFPNKENPEEYIYYLIDDLIIYLENRIQDKNEAYKLQYFDTSYYINSDNFYFTIADKTVL